MHGERFVTGRVLIKDKLLVSITTAESLTVYSINKNSILTDNVKNTFLERHFYTNISTHYTQR